MNKPDLIRNVAEKTGVSLKLAEEVVDAFLDAIAQGLKNGGEVLVSGFGSFRVTHRKGRLGVNPRNPTQRIEIPPIKTPAFTAGKNLKKAVRM